MAHFAELDENNIVERILVIADEDCQDDGGNESEAVGVAFCQNLFGGGNWKQTSYNHRIRKQYAEIGGKYDSTRDEFVKPQPYASWTLDANNNWQPPLANPSTETQGYLWNEDAYQADNTQGWVAITNPT